MKRALSALLFAATLAGCEDHKPTSVVVAVSSEVPVPEEVNELNIEVQSEGTQKFNKVYTIVTQGEATDPTRTRLPGTITLFPEDYDDMGGRLTVTVKAKLSNGENRFVRKSTMSFVEAKQKLLRMPLRFACMDFPTVCRDDETCKAGACVPASVDLDQAPDYEETHVFSQPGACFDRDSCGDAKLTVPISDVFAGAAEGDCTVSMEDLAKKVPQDKTPEEQQQLAADIRQGKINFGFVWAANKTGKWTVVDQDPEEGWTFTDGSRSKARLSKGLCDVVQGRVKRPDGSPLFTKAIINTACAPKPATTPQCAPAATPAKLGRSPGGVSRGKMGPWASLIAWAASFRATSTPCSTRPKTPARASTF